MIGSDAVLYVLGQKIPQLPQLLLQIGDALARVAPPQRREGLGGLVHRDALLRRGLAAEILLQRKRDLSGLRHADGRLEVAHGLGGGFAKGSVRLAVVFQRVQPRLHLQHVVAGHARGQRAHVGNGVHRRFRGGRSRRLHVFVARHAVEHVLIGDGHRRVHGGLRRRVRHARLLQIVVSLEQLHRGGGLRAIGSVARSGGVPQRDQSVLQRRHRVAGRPLGQNRVFLLLRHVGRAVGRRLVGQQNGLKGVGQPARRLHAAGLLKEPDRGLGLRVVNARSRGVHVAQCDQPVLNLHDLRAHLAGAEGGLVLVDGLHLSVHGVGPRVVGIELLLQRDVRHRLRLQPVGLIEQLHRLLRVLVVHARQLADGIAQLAQPMLKRVDRAAHRAALKRRVLGNHGGVVVRAAVAHRRGGEQPRLKRRRGDARLHDAVGLLKALDRRLRGRVEDAGHAGGIIPQLRKPRLQRLHGQTRVAQAQRAIGAVALPRQRVMARQKRRIVHRHVAVGIDHHRIRHVQIFRQRRGGGVGHGNVHRGVRLGVEHSLVHLPAAGQQAHARRQHQRQ